MGGIWCIGQKNGRWEERNVREQTDGRNSKLRVTDFVQKIVKLKKIKLRSMGRFMKPIYHDPLSGKVHINNENDSGKFFSVDLCTNFLRFVQSGVL